MTKGLEDMALDTEMQMTSLLRPFADHVHDLQATVSELTEHLRRVDARLEMQDKRLGDTSMWGQQLKSDIDPMKAHLMALQNGVSQLCRKKESLEQDHQETKATIVTLKAGLDSVADLCQKLRGDHEVMEGRVQQLSMDTQDMQCTLARNVEPTLCQHTRELADLTGLFHNADAKFRAQGKAAEEAAAAFKDFQQKYTKQAGEDQRSFQSLTSELKRLRAAIDDTTGRVATQGEELTGTSAEAKALRLLHGKLDLEVVVPLKFSVDKLRKELHELQYKIPSMEKGVNKLFDVVNRPPKKDKDSKDPNNNKWRNLSDYLEEVERVGKNNKEAIAALNAGQLVQDAQTEKFMGTLQHQIRDVQATLAKANGEIQELHTMHGTSRGLIDTSMDLHSDAKVEFNTNADRVKILREEITRLQSQLRDAQGAIARLHASLELCHDYMSGMRQGFRDANTRVVGSPDPMLPEPLRRDRSTTPGLPNARSARTAGTPGGAGASPGLGGLAPVTFASASAASPPPLTGTPRGTYAGTGSRIASR